MLSTLGRARSPRFKLTLSTTRGTTTIASAARVGIGYSFSRTRVEQWTSREGLGLGLRFQSSVGSRSVAGRNDGYDGQNSASTQKRKPSSAPVARPGSIEPPGTRRERLDGEMIRGKLLTTPSRLLKLILPLSTLAKRENDVEPLALLVHPQQPLSYLERLIQDEVPPAVDKHGDKGPPEISFMILECQEDEIKPKLKISEEDGEAGSVEPDNDQLPSQRDGSSDEIRNGQGRGSEGQDTLRHYVRWSLSTEIGDFIRDAAKVKEFAVVFEYSPRELIQVAVPSFNDRTYYLRMRLRKTSSRIKELTVIKNECDKLAHRGAQRVAMGGFGIMAGWWCLVYRLTFDTDIGWDTMEPVTYLVSLSTLMGSYLWFLYHNREVSYRTAFNLNISRRQTKLYQSKGLDLQRWEALVDEANSLRKEIKAVAADYDVDWNEKSDEQDDAVTDALKKERDQKDKSRGQSKKTEGHDDDD